MATRARSAEATIIREFLAERSGGLAASERTLRRETTLNLQILRRHLVPQVDQTIRGIGRGLNEWQVIGGLGSSDIGQEGFVWVTPARRSNPTIQPEPELVAASEEPLLGEVFEDREIVMARPAGEVHSPLFSALIGQSPDAIAAILHRKWRKEGLI